MKIQFEDLDNDCLMQVLEQLSPANLLKMARVNKRLNPLVKIKLSIKIQKIFVESTPKGNHSTQCPSTFFSCRHRCFDQNDVVYLDSMFAQMQRNEKTKRTTRKDFHKAPAKAIFLKTLARFGSIKSINFGTQELTNEVLQEVVKLCPEIECLTVKRSVVDESVWNDFFTQKGHQIVHFQWLVDNLRKMISSWTRMNESSIRILELITLKCANIKQVDFYFRTLTNERVALLKKLPKTCLIGISVFRIIYPFDDMVDFLSADQLKWTAIGYRNERLKELSFEHITNQYIITGQFPDFVSLKRLACRPSSLHGEMYYLEVSRFSKLEVFEYNANHEVYESSYKKMFGNMPEVKELKIDHIIYESLLPKTSLLQLKKLERIQVTVHQLEKLKRKPIKFINRLNWYVDMIPLLMRLAVRGDEEIMQQVAEDLKQLKNRQNKVEIVVMDI